MSSGIIIYHRKLLSYDLNPLFYFGGKRIFPLLLGNHSIVKLWSNLAAGMFFRQFDSVPVHMDRDHIFHLQEDEEDDRK